MENDDLIRRGDAQTELMLVAERYTVAHEAHGMGTVVWSEDLVSVSNALDTVRTIPAVDAVELVHGEWTVTRNTPLGDICKCSVCGSTPAVMYRWCPWCGARMDGRREDGDNVRSD